MSSLATGSATQQSNHRVRDHLSSQSTIEAMVGVVGLGTFQTFANLANNNGTVSPIQNAPPPQPLIPDLSNCFNDVCHVTLVGPNVEERFFHSEHVADFAWVDYAYILISQNYNRGLYV